MSSTVVCLPNVLAKQNTSSPTFAWWGSNEERCRAKATALHLILRQEEGHVGRKLRCPAPAKDESTLPAAQVRNRCCTARQPPVSLAPMLLLSCPFPGSVRCVGRGSTKSGRRPNTAHRESWDLRKPRRSPGCRGQSKVCPSHRSPLLVASANPCHDALPMTAAG